MRVWDMGGSACKIIYKLNVHSSSHGNVHNDFHGNTLKADVCLLTGGTIYGDAG